MTVNRPAKGILPSARVSELKSPERSGVTGVPIGADRDPPPSDFAEDYQSLVAT
jgi:hypothetical protein